MKPQSTRSDRKIRKTVEIMKDDFEWYISTHKASDDTNNTGFSSLICLLVSKYREVCSNPIDFNLHEIHPSEIAKAAAEEAKEEFESEGDREVREGIEED